MKQETEHTVFIVDDDEAVRGALEMLVKSVGLSVKTFEHGQAFLDQYEPADTGCLVLDMIQDRNLARSTISTNLAKLSPREKEVMDMVEIVLCPTRICQLCWNISKIALVNSYAVNSDPNKLDTQGFSQ